MAKPRDYKAEFARRQARSRAIYGKGYGSKGGARKLRRILRPAPADITARPRPITVITAGGVDITKTIGRAAGSHVRDALAAAGDKRVTVQVTFRNAAGEPKTRRLDRIPGGAGSDGDGGSGGGGGATPLGAVQITTGAGQMTAAELLSFLEDYDNIYEGLYDLWEFDY